MVTYQVPPDNRADLDPGHFADHTKISDNFSLLLMMPSGDVTGATDRTAIQARLSAGYEVRLGPGDFYLNDVLTPSNGSSLIGSGIASTTIHQVNTAKNGISWAGGNLSSVTVRSLTLSGPNSGTGRGISLVASTGGDPNVQGCHFEDLVIIDFGSHGFYAEILIVSSLTNVICRSNGGNGFSLGGGTNTSVTFSNCWADSNTASGYDLENVTYSALIGCAADNNAPGYFIFNATGLSLSGCGAEGSATCFQISGGTGITLESCFTFHCSGKSFWATGSAKNVTFTGCSENTPSAGVTASFQFDAGTSVNVIGWSFVTAAIQTAPPNQLNDGAGNLAIAGGSFLNTASVFGLASFYAGTSTVNSAPAITPTFANGTAAQLSDVTRDYMVYLQIGTPGTAFTLAIGPTSGVATTIVSSATPTATELLAVRLPAGWFLKWAGTSTTLARQTAVGC
jgi:hypothetical protein